ncbi:amino acid transporter [Mycolicibacterium conceptionense]|uniref:Amino acid transporter n=2 Tax=Mycolicibacterium TaxID=1866885 RepID=A0A0U1DWI4_9MYCO|nr:MULTISPECIES: APC family permease [Mycolicibacterium]ORV23641.1 amino acid transporter [Mycolicibacterium conceptionense]QZH66006.1 APC family permease [Mycolicibacterium farcinogenes]CQD23245.1 amino acid transporter [Mycolicibacterium conceptionense]
MHEQFSREADRQDGEENLRYTQELSRSLGLWGNVALCVAAITPAVGVFAIAPILLNMAGTGAVWALLIAGLLGLSMAACYGELGSAYPIAGGDYSVISRTLGKAAGFVSLVFTGPVCAFLIPAVVALTVATYLNVVVPLDARWVGAVVIALGTLIAILGVRFSARLVGLLLTIELLVVVFVTLLGFAQTQHSLSEVLRPTTFGPEGAQNLAAGVLLAAVAVAAFTYNGFQGALLFSEETSGGGRNIARSVFISLGVAVSFGVIPVLGGLLGARSLAEFTTSATPWQQLLTDTGGEGFNTIVSLGIALAVVNGVMALTPYFARVVYSSGRDWMWPGPISRALARVHPRFETPWVATLVIGVAGVLLILTTDVETMATVIGTIIALEMILVAVSAIVSRIRVPRLSRPYRMPLWPAAPTAAIALCLVVLAEQTRKDQIAALVIVGMSLLYYRFYLRPRSETHMKMLNPAESD